jgi:hypothetical protein
MEIEDNDKCRQFGQSRKNIYVYGGGNMPNSDHTLNGYVSIAGDTGSIETQHPGVFNWQAMSRQAKPA